MKVRQPIVAAALAALAAGCNPPPERGELPAAVDAVFAEYAGADGPGCSVGVIQDGQLIGSEGYGMANLDHGIPNDPSTVFRMASVSKQVTAGVIALLALRGDLDLDAPVRHYLPDFPDYPAPPTVRHLVHHTSGVRDYVGLMWLAGYRDEDFYTNAEVLAAINRQRELNFQPGAEHLYSRPQLQQPTSPKRTHQARKSPAATATRGPSTAPNWTSPTRSGTPAPRASH